MGTSIGSMKDENLGSANHPFSKATTLAQLKLVQLIWVVTHEHSRFTSHQSVKQPKRFL